MDTIIYKLVYHHTDTVRYEFILLSYGYIHLFYGHMDTFMNTFILSSYGLIHIKI